MLSIGLATDGSNDVRDEDLSPEFIEVAQEGDFYANGTGPVYPSPRVQEMPYNIKYPSIPLADVWRGRTMHSVRIYRGAAGGDAGDVGDVDAAAAMAMAVAMAVAWRGDGGQRPPRRLARRRRGGD
mgnify:CR=1 FL=1